MFNVKKVENYGPTPNDMIEAPSSGVSSRVTGSYERVRAQSHALVDECLTVRGDLDSDGDVLVKGRVIGNVRCKVIIIDAGASVEGGIEADEAIIRGSSKGTVRARRVCLEKTALVESEIHHQSFSAEEGARIMGTLTYSDNPMTAVAPAKPAKANGAKAAAAHSELSAEVD